MPATNWQEKSDPGEAERFETYAEQLRELQRRKARGRPADRGLHAKGQIGLEAKFTVLPDLPAHARVGLFASPREFNAIVRYSNGSGARQSDAKPDVRGIAVKLLGVPGKKLIPGMESATTQDFLLIRSASTPFRSADEFVPFVMAVAAPLKGLPKVIRTLGFFRTLQVLKKAARQLGEPMLPLILSEDASEFRVQTITRHLTTNIAVVQMFIEREIVCEGEEGSSGLVRIGRKL